VGIHQFPSNLSDMRTY